MPAPEPFFLASPRGRRFCLRHAPEGRTRGAMVYVHPFAEEMNKARRMCALQMAALRAAGWDVLQIDLHGCGDSEGDFADAGWQSWLDDVELARTWLRERAQCEPVLWGLRVGALLVAQVASRSPAPVDLLLWQPVLAGRSALQNFLRMRVTRALMGGAAERTGTRELREELARTGVLEIAGYAVSEALATGLETAELKDAHHARVRVAWLDVADAPASLSPASSRAVEQWQAAGASVDARAVEGPAFWQTPETAVCPALIGATVAATERFAA